MVNCEIHQIEGRIYVESEIYSKGDRGFERVVTVNFSRATFQVSHNRRIIGLGVKISNDQNSE